MKRLSLLIIPVSLLFISAFVLMGTKDVDAAYGDRASYKLDPWTFWQAGVSTDGWNAWEVSAYKYVYIPDDSNKYSDSTKGGSANSRIYGSYKGPYTDNLPVNNHKFDHEPAGTRPKNDEKECTALQVSHGYVANIESNGWSGKWIPTDEELAPSDDPPKWGEPDTTPGETTSFTPYLMDNNPYTVRSWTTARGLKKNRTYTWKFKAYIDEGAYMKKQTGNVDVDNKYCKIVGTTESGKILFVRYLSITTKKQEFKFNFDMDSNNSALKVEMMYGSFLLYADRDDECVKYKKHPELLIKHEEVVWTGTVHIEDCDIIQGNLLQPEEKTTTRRPGGSGEDWGDTPEKVTGVKVKNKAKKSVILSWKSAEYADKYQINYARKKNFKGGKKKYTRKRKYTIKGLKRKKVYYFRVRGVSEDYGAGPWSKKKKIKTK